MKRLAAVMATLSLTASGAALLGVAVLDWALVRRVAGLGQLLN